MSVYVIKYEPNPHLKPLLIGPLTDEQARERVGAIETTFSRNFDPADKWISAEIVGETFVEELKRCGQIDLYSVVAKAD